MTSKRAAVIKPGDVITVYGKRATVEAVVPCLVQPNAWTKKLVRKVRIFASCGHCFTAYPDTAITVFEADQ